MLYIYIYRLYEPPSKSIVVTWYETVGYRFLGGALSLYNVLFKSRLNNAKKQQNWLPGFKSFNCRGWIKGALVVLAIATRLGSYLSTFLDSFLSKEIYHHFNSKLEKYKINNSMKTKKDMAVVK